MSELSHDQPASPRRESLARSLAQTIADRLPAAIDELDRENATLRNGRPGPLVDEAEISDIDRRLQEIEDEAALLLGLKGLTDLFFRTP